jgi:DNA repair exonuclease SbcCD ATPase subunit
MYPRRLVLKNFGPFESLDYDFVHKPIAVIGENRTQDDQLSNGGGKAQSLDSDIMTLSGSIKMRDVRIGTKILGSDGKEQVVVAIHPQGIIDCYEITFNDGTKVKCNNEHLWKVASCYTPKKWVIKSLKDIMKQSIQCNCGNSNPYRYRVPTVDCIDYPYQKVDIDPYTLGALLGDGGFTQKIIGFTSPDEEIVNRLNFYKKFELVQSSNKLDYRINKVQNQEDAFWKILEKYNLFGLYSSEKFIPKEYMYNNKEVRLELLRGLLDTDGYVDKRGKVELTLTSKQLIEDVAFIARSLGCLCHKVSHLKSSYKNKKGEKIQCKDSYRLRIVPPKGLDLFHLKRKSERLMQEKKMNCVDRRIVDIQYVGKEEMQCITVSNKDGLYLTNNFIVTHNSFFGQGLFYGIYGVNLRGNVDKKLIRYGFDVAYTCVQIYCPIRKQTLSIEREIRIKGSSTLRLSLIDENEKVTPVNCATVLDGNRYVSNWIEISAEDAKSYYIVTKDNYNSFFKASNTEKLALISRFINFSKIDKTKDVIIEKIDEITEEKRSLEDEKSLLTGKLSVYEEQLEQENSKDQEAERNERIEEIRQEIQKIDHKTQDLQILLGSYQKDLEDKFKEKEDLEKIKEKVEKELSSIDLNRFQEVYSEIDKDLNQYKEDKRSTEKEIDKHNDRIRELKSTLNSIDNILSGVIVCPKCHHEFLLKCDKNIDELKEEKDKCNNSIEKEKEEKDECNQIVIDLDEVIKEYNSLRKETENEENSILQSQRSIKNKLNTVIQSIDTIDTQILKLNKNLKSGKVEVELAYETIEHKEKLIQEILKEPLKEKDTSNIEKRIESINKSISKIASKIEDKTNDIFNINQWTQRFKDFKMYLAMEQLKNIQFSANDILKKMGSDLRLMIEGFKKGANGKLKEEITPYIFRDEMELFTFYSEGEKARCEIALILALQSMINTTKKYGGMQFLLIDEILESVDSLGIENITTSISFFKQPILIVTHVPKLNEEISQIRVIKENGVSRLEV